MAKSAKTVSFVRDLKTRRIWKVASPFEWKLLNYTFILLTTALTDCSSSSSSESSRGLTSVSSVMGDQKGRLTGALTSKRQPFATTYTTHVQTNKHWRSKKAMRNRLRFASLQWNLYFMQKSGEGGMWHTRDDTIETATRAICSPLWNVSWSGVDGDDDEDPRAPADKRRRRWREKKRCFVCAQT